MNNLEMAIRKALENAGPDIDAAQRAHIFQSARNALEGSLRRQNVTDPVIVSEQRGQLESAIHAVESEIRDREHEQAFATTHPELFPDHEMSYDQDSDDAGLLDDPLLVDAPEPSFESRAEPAAEEVAAEDDFMLGGAGERLADSAPAAQPRSGEIHAPPVRAIKPRRVRRWKAKAFAAVTILAFLGASLWWVESSGLLLSADERDRNVPNPPPSVTDEDYEGAAQLKSLSREGGYSDKWAVVYDAVRPQDVGKGASAQADVKNGGSGPYLDIVSNDVGLAGSVTITIPQELVARMQGKNSSVALSLQGGEKPVQVAVECDFAGLGNCGRHRFVLSPNKADLLFQVRVKADGAPTGPGKLIINPDAGGEATAARLYTVHILPGS